MNDQARAAVRGWQDTVNATWEQQQAGLRPSALVPPPPAGRRLTPEEVAIARSVFGDALDTSQIKLTDDSLFPHDAVSFPNNIKFPSGTLKGPLDPAWLVHELTHIWQYQRGRTVPQLGVDAARQDYDYGGEQGLQDATAQGKRASATSTTRSRATSSATTTSNASAARTYRSTSGSSTRSGSEPRTACSQSPRRRLDQ